MTITSEVLKTIADGNGATTVFTYNFLIPNASSVLVIYTDADGNETELTTSQYTITGLNDSAGGTVTYPLVGSPIASGTTLTIKRELPLTQTKSISNQGAFYPQTVETALDYLTMQLQQVNDLFARALVTPDTEPSTNLEIPPIAQRANQLLGFDSDGNAIVAQPSSALVSSAMQPVVSASTLASARTAMGLGAVATLGIGAGLRNDGSSNLQVSSTISAVATNQSPVAADHRTQYMATGALTFTLARANTLWSGYEFTAFALTDSLTFTPDSHDTFYGGTSGSSVVFPIGSVIRIWTNAAASGTWYFAVMPLDTTLPQGYLSNNSTQPVIMNDNINQGTLYYHNFVGDKLPIYNGVMMVPYVFPKLSLILDATGHASGSMYDAFGIISNGEPILVSGPAWRQPGIAITGATNASPIVITANSHGLSNGDEVVVSGVQGNTAANGIWTVANKTANTFELSGSTGNAAYTTATGFAASRGTGAGTTQLSRATPGGIWVNAVSMTGRNNSVNYTIAAGQATYLGSFFCGAGAAQVTCHKTYGGTRRWEIFNAYNRQPINLTFGDTTATWTYNSATWRQARGQSSAVMNCIIGLPEESLDAQTVQRLDNGNNGTIGAFAVGLASIAPVGALGGGGPNVSTANVFAISASRARIGPIIGAVPIWAIEATPVNANTVTYNGTNLYFQSLTTWRG